MPKAAKAMGNGTIMLPMFCVHCVQHGEQQIVKQVIVKEETGSTEG